ncbi:MAG: PucR family transcriptional regulator ligand-binding domain-containing protein [Clostridiales bacterium]|nr:PucR family transcriptional regulator ligand-binding domain-containing protein [Clostridiales bacterium]
MITVNELLKALPYAPVLAGQEGLDRGVETVSFIDSPSSVEWLRGGEVILTTAFLYRDDMDLQMNFVEKLADMNVAALGLKLGRFIETIPEQVIKLANERKFPIFGVAYDMVWSEIFTKFHTLKLQKNEERSILSTEIITFDKLFRSSTWDSETIRENFLKCLDIPACIVNDEYEVLSKNNFKDVGLVETWCSEKRKINVDGTDDSETQQQHHIIGREIYPGERLLLHYDVYGVLLAELDWIVMLYQTIRNKNKFMQDKTTLWKNFVNECLIRKLGDSSAEYARMLDLRNLKAGAMLIFSGPEPHEAVGEVRRIQRANLAAKSLIIYDSVTKDGEIIMLYGKNTRQDECDFRIELREILQKTRLSSSDCKIAVGSFVNQPQDMLKSYEQAGTAMQMKNQLLPSEPIVFYQDICILDTLRHDKFDFSEIEYLQQQVHTFDACQTLEVFLEHGNIKRAANYAFVHDSTMRYRVQKIEQCLNIDFGNPINRASYLIKLKLWHLMKPEGS